MSRIAIGEIDNVIHGRLRLGIMAYLADAGVADFAELKRVLEATQGNLGANLITLEEAGYITIEKSFVGRKPLTRAHHPRRTRGISTVSPSNGRAGGERVQEALSGVCPETPNGQGMWLRPAIPLVRSGKSAVAEPAPKPHLSPA
jgi:DNA-binding transcriptional ArsR family regulator